ncbi:MAG: hypothetical protein IJ992_01355, partial [Lentisphaeria bacterium]|nr:hypothetical protein [Lentisphaeria bacterium]
MLIQQVPDLGFHLVVNALELIQAPDTGIMFQQLDGKETGGLFNGLSSDISSIPPEFLVISSIVSFIILAEHNCAVALPITPSLT